jgi:hypothetical protein
VHLVGFTIEIYHNGLPYERQIPKEVAKANTRVEILPQDLTNRVLLPLCLQRNCRLHYFC